MRSNIVGSFDHSNHSNNLEELGIFINSKISNISRAETGRLKANLVNLAIFFSIPGKYQELNCDQKELLEQVFFHPRISNFFVARMDLEQFETFVIAAHFLEKNYLTLDSQLALGDAFNQVFNIEINKALTSKSYELYPPRLANVIDMTSQLGLKKTESAIDPILLGELINRVFCLEYLTLNPQQLGKILCGTSKLGFNKDELKLNTKSLEDRFDQALDSIMEMKSDQQQLTKILVGVFELGLNKDNFEVNLISIERIVVGMIPNLQSEGFAEVLEVIQNLELFDEIFLEKIILATEGKEVELLQGEMSPDSLLSLEEFNDYCQKYFKKEFLTKDFFEQKIESIKLALQTKPNSPNSSVKPSLNETKNLKNNNLINDQFSAQFSTTRGR